jgi:hypothetical protein
MRRKKIKYNSIIFIYIVIIKGIFYQEQVCQAIRTGQG